LTLIITRVGRRLTVFAAALAVLITGLAFGPADPAAGACRANAESDREGGVPAQPPVALPAGTHRDANWLVLSQTMTTSIDPASGKPLTVTVTVRQDPRGKPHQVALSGPPEPLLSFGPRVALGAFCNFNTGVSFETDIGFGGYPGVIAQHYTLYADRYIAGTYPTDWVYAYLNWETDVWWTRTDASYDISSIPRAGPTTASTAHKSGIRIPHRAAVFRSHGAVHQRQPTRTTRQ